MYHTIRQPYIPTKKLIMWLTSEIVIVGSVFCIQLDFSLKPIKSQKTFLTARGVGSFEKNENITMHILSFINNCWKWSVLWPELQGNEQSCKETWQHLWHIPYLARARLPFLLAMEKDECECWGLTAKLWKTPNRSMHCKTMNLYLLPWSIKQLEVTMHKQS